MVRARVGIAAGLVVVVLRRDVVEVGRSYICGGCGINLDGDCVLARRDEIWLLDFLGFYSYEQCCSCTEYRGMMFAYSV